MAVKTLTFNFIKKTKLKFSKYNHSNKANKKKLLGLQALSFYAKEAYHLAPVKIVKNELEVNKKSKEIEVTGSLKFKVNVRDQFVSNFNKALKEQSIEFHSLGFNTDPTPGLEITSFELPKPGKTKEFLEVK